MPSSQTQPGWGEAGEAGRMLDGASGLLLALWQSLCRLRWCHPLSPVKCRCNSLPAADKQLSVPGTLHDASQGQLRSPCSEQSPGAADSPRRGAAAPLPLQNPCPTLLGWPPPPRLCQRWILPCLGPGLRDREVRECAEGLPEAGLVTSQAVLWGGDRAEDSTQLPPHSGIRAAFSQHRKSSGLLQEQLQALL